MSRNNSGPGLLFGAALLLASVGMADRLDMLPVNLALPSQAQVAPVVIYPTAAPAPQQIQPAPQQVVIMPTAAPAPQQVVQIAESAPTAIVAQIVATVVPIIAPTEVVQITQAQPTVIAVSQQVEQPSQQSLTSAVMLQGATDHKGTSITIVNNATGNVVASTLTDADGRFDLNIEPGEYQIIAHSAAGSRLPACGSFSVPGTIPQTMLLSGGGFNTDVTMNIGAAALFAIQMQLTIPDDLVPILDIDKNGIVNEQDANALIADPKKLTCQPW